MTMNCMTTMHKSADACTAPAYQYASMTANCAVILDTAVLAVSFLRDWLLCPVMEAARIVRIWMSSAKAKL